MIAVGVLVRVGLAAASGWLTTHGIAADEAYQVIMGVIGAVVAVVWAIISIRTQRDTPVATQSVKLTVSEPVITGSTTPVEAVKTTVTTVTPVEVPQGAPGSMAGRPAEEN